MNMKRHVSKHIQELPPHMQSGGLTGESLAGTRTNLLSLLSKMQTDEPAELSLLSYMCGDGVTVSKCSAGIAVSKCSAGNAVSKCSAGIAVSKCSPGIAVSKCSADISFRKCSTDIAVNEG